MCVYLVGEDSQILIASGAEVDAMEMDGVG